MYVLVLALDMYLIYKVLVISILVAMNVMVLAVAVAVAVVTRVPGTSTRTSKLTKLNV